MAYIPTLPPNLNEYRNQSSTPYMRSAVPAVPERFHDAYAEEFQTALQKVTSFDCPTGLLLWLREAYPILYLELVDGLPDEIHRLWSIHDPLEEFVRILNAWVEAFQTACEMFKAAEAGRCGKAEPEKSNG